MEFNLDAFIAQVNKDSEAVSSSSNGFDRKSYLNKILCNARPYQGTISILPVMNRKTGNFYTKMQGVLEYKAPSSLFEDNEVWYKILPIDYYGELSKEEIDLYNEVKGYITYLIDSEEVDWSTARWRSYSLFYGLIHSIKSDSEEDHSSFEMAPALLVYPSVRVIESLATAMNNKIQIYKDRTEWLLGIFNPNNIGYNGVLQITFKKGSGVGYDIAINFERNSDMETLVDPSMEISDDTIDLFNGWMKSFMGWIYPEAEDATNLFNMDAFKELRDHLKVKINSIGSDQEPKEEKVENKNSLKSGNNLPF